ncbi:MAG: ABC transporter substrate-binding protein, partial [Chloroflexota bacterium]
PASSTTGDTPRSTSCYRSSARRNARAAASGAAAASKPAASPAASAQASAGAAGAKKDVVKLGVLQSASDAGFYVGLDKGWYAEQGIDIQTTQFPSAANMVAPLSQGQLDAGGGAPGAGLDNAIARDIGIKMVADKAFVPADSSYLALLVRKDLADNVKSFKDLKGFKLALSGEAIAPQVALDRGMRKEGLTAKDLDIVFMGFPDMAAAFAGKSIQAAQPIEPFATQIPSQGTGVIFKRSNEYSPNDQNAVVLYGPNFVKDRPDVAKRFMVAYLRGIRLYNDAFFKKPKDQAAYDYVVGVLTKATTVKDVALYAKMEMPSLNPDGKMVVQSMKDDQDWYLQNGYQKTKVDIDGGVDMSYADYAVQQLGGPYKA